MPLWLRLGILLDRILLLAGIGLRWWCLLLLVLGLLILGLGGCQTCGTESKDEREDTLLHFGLSTSVG